MPDLEDIAKNLVSKKRKQSRRQQLLMLIHQILSGQLDTQQEPLDNLFQMSDGSRPHYISPVDRSTYNSGYMETKELEAGTPNVW